MMPIERAARALAGWTPNVTSWANVCANPKDEKTVHEHYLNEVRAVLTAIREPSEAMVEAADQGCFAQGGELAASISDIWRTMIDAAMAEIATPS